MTHKIALAAAFSAIFAAGLVASSANAEEGEDPKPCVAKTFKIKKVENLCKTGGQKAVKAAMKKATKKAKAEGVLTGMKCKDCHVDLKGYKLKGDNPQAIKKWL